MAAERAVTDLGGFPLIRKLVARCKRVLKPQVLSLLSMLPATSRIAGRGHVLMFHRVVPPEHISPYGMSEFEITPLQLAHVVDFFLERGYRIISLDDLCGCAMHESDERRFIVLTFDDGYRDTFTNAYPILKARNAPFTVFVTFNYLERRAVKWDYLAESVIHAHDSVAIDTPQGRVVMDSSTPDRKRHSCAALQDILYAMADPPSNDWIRAFFESHCEDPLALTDALMMDWHQLRTLAADPLVTIGAHSLNHYVLARLEDLKLMSEVSLSKTELESQLAIEVRHFAYPYGRAHEAGEREYSVVERCGYRTGSTGIMGNLIEPPWRLHCLPRFCLGANATSDRLSAIANGFLPFVVNRFRRRPVSTS